MKINVRNMYSGNKDVSVEHENTKIDIGVMSEEECFELAKTLFSSIEDLLNNSRYCVNSVLTEFNIDVECREKG
jgi:hypothetical protein